MSGKAVIFGGGGQLGGELVSVLQQRGWQVRAFQRLEVDITNAEHIEQVIASIEPDVVLNAAAYNQVDLAEREPAVAYAANALAVRSLALACRQLGAKLVHFSTDYVFDGRKGSAYQETDETHPLSAYGVSKLAGELYARAYLDDALMIRVCGVFGPRGASTARGNFVETMLRLASNGQPLRVISEFVASPTYAPAIASRAIDLIEGGFRGLFHCGGGEAISWYDYAALIFQAAGLQPELRPATEREYRTEAKRPKYSALSNAKLYEAGIAPMPPLQEVLADYMQRRPSHSR